MTVGLMNVSQITVSKMTVSKMTVSKMTVGKNTFGQMWRNRPAGTSDAHLLLPSYLFPFRREIEKLVVGSGEGNFFFPGKTKTSSFFFSSVCVPLFKDAVSKVSLA